MASAIPVEKARVSSIMWNYVRMEDLERLKQLLNVQRHNIDIEYCPVEGQRTTALHLTASKGNRCVAEVLVRAGADVNAQNRNCETALHRCCGRGDADMCMLLLKNGAVINVVDDTNSTPLHILAATDHLRTLELVVQNSVPNYNIKDSADRTAGDIARICGNVAMEKILKEEAHRASMMDKLYFTKVLKKIMKKWARYSKQERESREMLYTIDEKGQKVYLSK